MWLKFELTVSSQNGSKTKTNCVFAADNTAQVLEKWMDLYLVGGSVALNKFSSQSHLSRKSKFFLKFEERDGILHGIVQV